MGRLTEHSIRKLTPGKYADGGGLYLFANDGPPEAWTWRFIFAWNGRRPTLTLGSKRDMTLADARAAAAAARAQVRAGVNPIDARKAERRIAAGASFGDVADEYFKSKSSEYRNDKYRGMVERALTKTLAPIRKLPVADVGLEDVLRVLKPVWIATPETGKRLREKIEAILDAATAKGLRTRENPARWRGHLEHLLPKRQAVSKKHHAAMPYKDVPAFMRRLREVETVAALALEFAILTAARSGEVFAATWCEIDFDAKVWTLSPERMKAGREHRVPLSDAAIAVLAKMKTIQRDDWIFPGQRKGKHLSHISMAKILERLNITGATPHGFRSSFRDWAGNETNVPREVCEAALAHRVGDSAEQAYRRDTALEKRRNLMSLWADYVSGGNVVPLRRNA